MLEAPRPETLKASAVTVESQPSHGVRAALWDLYAELFAPLEDKALLRHLYEKDEFDALMRDPRVLKLVGWSRGKVVGLAAITNELEIVPQISPAFLRRRYPEPAARKAVYFCIFLFIGVDFQRRTLFPRLVSAMGQLVARHSGVVVFDVAEYNSDMFSVDAQVRRVSLWFPDSTFATIDAQRYYGIELPQPMPSADGLDGGIMIDLTV